MSLSSACCHLPAPPHLSSLKGVLWRQRLDGLKVDFAVHEAGTPHGFITVFTQWLFSNAKTPLSITQCNSTAPQAALPKMTITMNRHLSKTVSTKTEQSFHKKETIYCREVALSAFLAT